VFTIAAPEMFWRPAHKVLAALMLAMHDAGLPIDPQTVLARVIAAGETRLIDGPYLHTLLQRSWNAANAAAYAAEVRECYRRRLTIEAAVRVVQTPRTPRPRRTR
jgi:replicative DNA helicase